MGRYTILEWHHILHGWNGNQRGRSHSSAGMELMPCRRRQFGIIKWARRVGGMARAIDRPNSTKHIRDTTQPLVLLWWVLVLRQRHDERMMRQVIGSTPPENVRDTSWASRRGDLRAHHMLIMTPGLSTEPPKGPIDYF